MRAASLYSGRLSCLRASASLSFRLAAFAAAPRCSSTASASAAAPASASAAAAAAPSSAATAPGALLSEAEFVSLADACLSSFEGSLCAALESHPSLPHFDASLASGVLTLRLGGGGAAGGTYVINRQVPNRQLWWSSPVSGPRRYNYERASGRWRGARDGDDLAETLRREVAAATGVDVRLG